MGGGYDLSQQQCSLVIWTTHVSAATFSPLIDAIKSIDQTRLEDDQGQKTHFKLMDVEARIALALYLDRELICLEPVLRECNICLPFILNVSLLRFLSFFLSFHIDRLQVGIRTSRRMAKAIRCSKATGKLTITFSIQCGLACSFTALMF